MKSKEALQQEYNAAISKALDGDDSLLLALLEKREFISDVTSIVMIGFFNISVREDKERENQELAWHKIYQVFNLMLENGLIERLRDANLLPYFLEKVMDSEDSSGHLLSMVLEHIKEISPLELDSSMSIHSNLLIKPIMLDLFVKKFFTDQYAYCFSGKHDPDGVWYEYVDEQSVAGLLEAAVWREAVEAGEIIISRYEQLFCNKIPDSVLVRAVGAALNIFDLEFSFLKHLLSQSKDNLLEKYGKDISQDISDALLDVWAYKCDALITFLIQNGVNPDLLVRDADYDKRELVGFLSDTAFDEIERFLSKKRQRSDKIDEEDLDNDVQKIGFKHSTLMQDRSAELKILANNNQSVDSVDYYSDSDWEIDTISEKSSIDKYYFSQHKVEEAKEESNISNGDANASSGASNSNKQEHATQDEKNNNADSINSNNYNSHESIKLLYALPLLFASSNIEDKTMTLFSFYLPIEAALETSYEEIKQTEADGMQWLKQRYNGITSFLLENETYGNDQLVLELMA